MRLLFAALFVICSCSAALAWKNAYNKNCPSRNKSWDWVTYLSTKPKTKSPHMVSVQLRYARKVNDPEARGGLNPKYCYTVFFDHKKGAYESYITSGAGSAKTKTGLPGSPLNYEINVYGVLLLFNSAGEVIDKKGNVIGEMVCYGSNDCRKY